MAFGPATFLKAMNTTLAPLLRRCAPVFFDDILIYSCTYEEHLSHLRQVFCLLQNDHWLVKPSKCEFTKQELKYLGHIISAAGVATDPDKVTAVLNWPQPRSPKELRSFLGLAGYYHRFVKHFGIISKPLTELLKKGIIFTWTQDH